LSHLPAKIYAYAGGGEGHSMIPNVEKLKQTLTRQGNKKIEINLSLDPEGKHNESQWGKEFLKPSNGYSFNH
jgi:hypothetical protein